MSENAGPDPAANGAPKQTRPPVPKWVLALLIAGAILLVALVASLLLGVQHGPGMHGGAGPSTPASTIQTR